jgi:serine/threonine protein phosphatase 1
MENNTFVHSDVINPGDVIAVGDCHGQVPQFIQLVEWIEDSGASVIFLGDLIDRSNQPGGDLVILETVEDMTNNPKFWGIESCISLRGNHEDLMLRALDGDVANWVYNGGDIANIDSLAKHADWLRELPYYVTVGDTLFSHAGVFPGENPADYMQTEELRDAFVWNRGSFLKRGPEFEAWSPTLKKAVFGHSPRKDGQPYRLPNAVCADSGAFFSGVLTAYNSTQDTIMQFFA